MGCITRFFLALLNLIIPITDWDIKVPALVTTSASNIFNLFVIDPTGGGPDPTIHASIMRVDISRSQTEYWIVCLETAIIDSPPTAPCNYIHGASVTVNPTGMTLDIHRATDFMRLSAFPVNGTYVILEQHTSINVGGAASCDIYGSTLASCTGDITSNATAATFVAGETDTWGRSSRVDIETISTTIANVTAHSIPVTITAGAEKIPAPTTTSFSDGGARATGQASAVIVGAMALVGVVALM